MNFLTNKNSKKFVTDFINRVKTELSDLYYLKYKFTRNIVKGQLKSN
jgi:hypothetical protein